MSEESPADQVVADAAQTFTAEDVEAKITEATQELKGEIETLKGQIPKPPEEDSKLPWEKDPDWKAKDYGQLTEAQERYLRRQGFATKEEIMAELKAQEEKKAEEQQQTEAKQKEAYDAAMKRVDEDVKEITEELKKEDKELDKKAVLEFAQKWNSSHDSKLTTFRDAYELYAAQPKPRNDKDKVISGSSTDAKGDEKAPKIYRKGMSPDDVLARVLADFN